MGPRVAVVSQMHPLDGDRSSVHDEPLFGVVVEHPIASLHRSTGCGVDSWPDGTRNLEILESWSKEGGTYGDTSFVRALARIT